MPGPERFAGYNVDDFMHGNPLEVMDATEHPKILIWWPHGHERLAPRIAHHLVTERPELLEHVDYMCGNPRAAALQIRDTEETSRWALTGQPGYKKGATHGSDINRSFLPEDGQPRTYEEFRALGALNIMRQRGYDYVLDVHTSPSDVDKFLLIANRTDAVHEIIGASSLTRIVHMPENIARVALIGQVEASASIEYNSELADSPEAIEDCVDTIENLIKGVGAPQEREIFYVEHTIPNGTKIEPDASNFVWSEVAQLYPVIHGDKSYVGKHQGFAAYRRELEVI